MDTVSRERANIEVKEMRKEWMVQINANSYLHECNGTEAMIFAAS